MVDCPNYPAFRFAAGAALLSCGLAMLVTGGISDTGVTGLRLSALLPTAVGMFLVLPNRPLLGWRK